MKFPVFSLLTGNFGPPRDEFAPDCLLQRRVINEPQGKVTAKAVALPLNANDQTVSILFCS